MIFLFEMFITKKEAFAANRQPNRSKKWFLFVSEQRFVRFFDKKKKIAALKLQTWNMTRS